MKEGEMNEILEQHKHGTSCQCHISIGGQIFCMLAKNRNSKLDANSLGDALRTCLDNPG
jgi:hypothetical protein